MGGCAPSKMPNGEQVERKGSKSGHNSTSTRKSSHSGTSSLNASEQRIKALADTEDTYGEFIKIGRKESIAEEGHLLRDGANGECRVNGLMKNAESQTMHTSHSNVNSVIPGPRSMRPSGLPATFLSHTGGYKAPLAMSETASELGTPTPMDENKAFGKFYPSTTTVAGQLKPLFPGASGQPKMQLVYPPKLPTSIPGVSSSSAASSIMGSAPSASHIPRPKGPVPPPPVVYRTIAPPSSLPGSARNGTDNVPVVTDMAYTRMSPLQSNPAAMQTRPLNGLDDKSSKGRSMENMKSTLMMGGKLSMESIPGEGSRLRSKTENSTIITPTPVSGIPVPASRLPGSKLSLRPPASSVGSAPRGPLALGVQKQTVSNIAPLKPVRKSPQSTAANDTDSHYVNTIGLGAGDASSALVYENHEAVRQFRTAAHPSLSSVPSERFSGISLGDVAYRDSFFDDDYSAGGEAFAERPKQFYVDDFALNDMIATLAEAKGLAEDLLLLNEQSSHVLVDGSVRKTRGRSNISTVKENREYVKDLLTPPTNDVLQDPKKALDLIVKLQNALRNAAGM